MQYFCKNYFTSNPLNWKGCKLIFLIDVFLYINLINTGLLKKTGTVKQYLVLWETYFSILLVEKEPYSLFFKRLLL